LWVGIHQKKGYPINSHDLGLHEDADQPGTLGCIGMYRADLVKAYDWFERYDIAELVVDHGHNTVPRPTAAPAVPPPPPPSRVKLFFHSGGMRCLRDGKEEKSLRLDYHSGRVGLAVAGVQLPADQILSISLDVAIQAGK
jgi:hypothetical protein